MDRAHDVRPEQTVPPADTDLGSREAESSALVLATEPLRPSPILPADREPPRRRRSRAISLALAGLALAGVAVVWYWLTPSAPPFAYKTAVVDRGTISATVSATGTVTPVVSVQVGSQVSGAVQALYADYNSVVRKGDLIARIDPAPFRARVSQAKAQLTSAQGTLERYQATLAQRKLDLARQERLFPQGFTPKADLDQARTNHRDAVAQVKVGEAQVAQANAALAAAQLDLKYTEIYSPVDGLVISRNVDVGQTVAASFQTPTLFVIAQDLARMQVNANVSEADIGGVSEGKDAEFTVDAYPNEPFMGTVTQVRHAPISIQNVVTYDVVIGVDNRGLKLKPGMTANVTIIIAKRDQALRVPNAAVRFRPPGTVTERAEPTVWTLDAAAPRPVLIRPGISNTVHTEILEGSLREGDLVIVGLRPVEEVGDTTLPPGFGLGPRMR